MFVLKSTYEKLRRENAKLLDDNVDAASVIVKWIKKYNREVKDHRQTLEEFQEYLEKAKSPLSAKEIKSLLSLCHPDKHNNSVISNRMTQLLLKLRESIKNDK